MCLLCASLSAREDPELTKVAEGIYARIVSPDGNAVANAGVAVLDQSVLVFDTHFTPEAGASLLAAIRSVTPKPVRYVVNSHWHADHTHGNQVFAGAQLISSSNARRDMLQNDLPSLNRAVRIAQTQIEKLRQAVSKEPDAAAAAEDARTDQNARRVSSDHDAPEYNRSGYHGGRKHRDP